MRTNCITTPVTMAHRLWSWLRRFLMSTVADMPKMRRKRRRLDAISASVLSGPDKGATSSRERRPSSPRDRTGE